MLLGLLFVHALALLQQVGQVLVLILFHPGQTIPIDNIALSIGLQILNPLLLLLSPQLLGLLLQLLVLCLEQRKLFQALGTLNVVLLLLLSLESHLQLLLLLLQLLNLFCHYVIRIHLGNSVLVQLAKHLLPDVGLSKLLDLVLVVLRLD